MKLKITEENYAYYKKIIEIFYNNIHPNIKWEYSPMNVLDRWEKENMSLAKRGLQEGFRDVVSQIKEMPKEMIESIDIELKNNDFPGIRKLQGLVKDTISKVLKRGKIRTLDEFYIIKEMVVDQASDISEADRARLSLFMEELEFSKK